MRDRLWHEQSDFRDKVGHRLHLAGSEHQAFSGTHEQVSNYQINMTTKATQKNSIFKRKKRKHGSNNSQQSLHCLPKVIEASGRDERNMQQKPKILTLAINVLLGVALVRSILCDTTTAVHASSVESPQQIAAAAGAKSGLVNLQRFAEEPRDTLALLGRPTDLMCSVENKHGELVWFREDFSLGLDGLYPEYQQRYSLGSPNQPQQQQANGATSNWALHIKEVKLVDEAHFRCEVSDVDAQHRRIESRRAKLTVIQPPTHLTVQDTFVPDENATTNNGDNPLYATPWQQQQPTDQIDSAANGHQREGSGEEQVRVIVVRQDDRLRLECKADLAKPHAELVWLDHHQREISRRSLENASHYEQSFLEQRVSVDTREPVLAATSLVLSFKVQRNHTNQVFTCQARHVAFQQLNQYPDLYGREPTYRVKLDVHYKPEIEDLVKEPQQALEDQPVKFQCIAHARPELLTYRWFIDDQLVANATEPELLIGKLTRQLHLREIKCQVSNTVGTSTVVHRLVVRYSPAFATHLLHQSIITADSPFAEPTIALPSPGEDYDIQTLMSKQEKRVSGTQQREPSRANLHLAGQLAVGFKQGQEVQLRCDFDANPSVQSVVWYKVNIQQRELLRDVQPYEADDLIASGEAGAIFLPRTEQQHQQLHQFAEERNRERDRLDYRRMSDALIEELASFIRNQANLSPDQSAAQAEADFTIVTNKTTTQHNQYIQEPLQWVMRPSTTNTQLVHQSERASHMVANRDPQNSGDPEFYLSNLTLLQPPAHEMERAPLALTRREAPISTSTVLLSSVNNDTMGKYICLTKTADGFQPLARAIYLVPNNRPRIVSAKEQYVPIGRDQVQIECLAQISTNWDTSFTWSRDNKIIDPLDGDISEKKKYSEKKELSPDMLFMRSVLQINHAQTDDEGIYTCTVNNAFGPPDHMDIRLKYTMPTGFPFYVMAALAVGTVLLLACVVSIMIVCAPRSAELDAKLAALSHGPNEDRSKSDPNGSLDSSSQISSDRKSPPSSIEINQMVQAHDNQQEESNFDIRLMNNQQSQQHQPMSQQMNGIYDRCDSSDSTATHRAGHVRVDNSQHKLRSSLRQPMVGNQNRLSKYAAIQESLEHKLHLGKPLFGQPRLPAETMECDHRQHSERSVDVPHQMGKTHSISELDRGSLVNKIWDRLRLRSERSSGNRRVKSRPVISMPVQEIDHSTGAKRSSLSTSLSMIADGGPNESTSDKKGGARRSVNLNHPNKGHLLSSRAKLIQDSATGSDGTACSSSRSSSSSGQNHHDQMNNSSHQQQSNLHHQNNVVDYRAAATNSYVEQPNMWMQPCEMSHGHMNPHVTSDCGVYVGDIAQDGAYQQSIDNSNLYTNGHLMTMPTYAPQLQTQMVAPNYVPAPLDSQPGWSPEASQTTFGHYQHPMILQGEPYYPAQQSNVQPCYATICTKPASHVQFRPSPTSIMVNSNSPNNNSSNYGTLPVRPPSQHQMVPTSDAADAFYEDNYGTLISSAYKTLGYANSTASVASKQNGIATTSSASSSPNSLATNRSTNLQAVNHHQHAEQMLNSNQGDPNNNLQVTLVKADKITTATNSISSNTNDNGQATHV